MDRRQNTCYQYAAVALDKVVCSFLWNPEKVILISDFVISFVTSYQFPISGNLKILYMVIWTLKYYKKWRFIQWYCIAITATRWWLSIFFYYKIFNFYILNRGSNIENGIPNTDCSKENLTIFIFWQTNLFSW